MMRHSLLIYRVSLLLLFDVVVQCTVRLLRWLVFNVRDVRLDDRLLVNHRLDDLANVRFGDRPVNLHRIRLIVRHWVRLKEGGIVLKVGK